MIKWSLLLTTSHIFFYATNSSVLCGGMIFGYNKATDAGMDFNVFVKSKAILILYKKSAAVYQHKRQAVSPMNIVVIIEAGLTRGTAVPKPTCA
ncbi:MAG: hypothetical protein J0H29_05390 [Sphingobacteriales bacterium]|nr:hypothetical protein [Sphingobacteriales bacterium]OJY90407.1 MAG: hypothetical protein BGP14_12155 [Sphingobacteriales bacterium 44-15]